MVMVMGSWRGNDRLIDRLWDERGVVLSGTSRKTIIDMVVRKLEVKKRLGKIIDTKRCICFMMG